MPPIIGATCSKIARNTSLEPIERDDIGRLRFRHPAAASRAVHLLQHLVDASMATPEPLLVFNKILCGLLIPTPVELRIDLSPREIEMSEGLLKAMIAHWKMLKSTSIDGLRKTFLEREGRLLHSSEGWKLTVQRKTIDILLDYLPWSIGVVSWMLDPLWSPGKKYRDDDD